MSEVDDLRSFLAARDDAEREVAPAMRSQLHLTAGAEETFVLVHGLTASPLAWSAITAMLVARGANVVVLRLPLHGHAVRMTTALRGLSPDLLTRDIAAVVERVATLGTRITLAGHSLGGTLTLHAAATFPSVARGVAIAPFLGIAALPHELHRVVIPLLQVLPNFFLWWDPFLRERLLPEHGYPRYPLHALTAGIGIAEAVYDDAHRAPAARRLDVVLNARESSVNNRAAMRLADRWRAAGAAIAVHDLRGLPLSHDIIEPERAYSERARSTLVDIIAGEGDVADRVHVV
jgi:alpha-beta hydrolase superfamily lysophospholipase